MLTYLLFILKSQIYIIWLSSKTYRTKHWPLIFDHYGTYLWPLMLLVNTMVTDGYGLCLLIIFMRDCYVHYTLHPKSVFQGRRLSKTVSSPMCCHNKYNIDLRVGQYENYWSHKRHCMNLPRSFTQSIFLYDCLLGLCYIHKCFIYIL